MKHCQDQKGKGQGHEVTRRVSTKPSSIGAYPVNVTQWYTLRLLRSNH